MAESDPATSPGDEAGLRTTAGATAVPGVDGDHPVRHRAVTSLFDRPLVPGPDGAEAPPAVALETWRAVVGGSRHADAWVSFLAGMERWAAVRQAARPGPSSAPGPAFTAHTGPLGQRHPVEPSAVYTHKEATVLRAVLAAPKACRRAVLQAVLERAASADVPPGLGRTTENAGRAGGVPDRFDEYLCANVTLVADRTCPRLAELLDEGGTRPPSSCPSAFAAGGDPACGICAVTPAEPAPPGAGEPGVARRVVVLSRDEGPHLREARDGDGPVSPSETGALGRPSNGGRTGRRPLPRRTALWAVAAATATAAVAYLPLSVRNSPPDLPRPRPDAAAQDLVPADTPPTPGPEPTPEPAAIPADPSPAAAVTVPPAPAVHPASATSTPAQPSTVTPSAAESSTPTAPSAPGRRTSPSPSAPPATGTAAPQPGSTSPTAVPSPPVPSPSPDPTETADPTAGPTGVPGPSATQSPTR